MTDYTDLIEQLLTKSENSPWDSLMDDAAIAIRSQGKRIAELEAQLSAIRALLPDDLYSHSKDWSSGDLAYRIEWLKIGYESEKSLAGELLSQLDALAKQEPVAYINNDRSKFFIPSMEGKEVQHSPYLAHWMVSWDRLYTNPIPTDPGKVTVTTDDHGRCVAVTRTDDEGRILSVIWEAGEMEKPVNARLVEALKRCRFDSFNMSLADLEFCRSALAAAEALQSEPVRSMNRSNLYVALKEAGAEIVDSCCSVPDKCCAADKWSATTNQIEKAIESLPPQKAEPVRLTDEQWDEFIKHIRETYLNRPIPLSGLVRKIQKEVLRANGFKVED